MKLRLFVARSLVCSSLFASGILAAGQTRRVVVPHAAGVTPPPVHLKHSSTPDEVVPAGATWTKAKNAPAVSVGAMLLLTDGRVLVHSEPNCTGCTGDYNDWYTLTPDNTGSYVNGTWKQVASFPNGYNPLFFASAVLKDGKVAVQGGEYNCPNSSCQAVWQSLGALYDPVANTWTSTTPPTKSNIGDAESVVLPDGTWMVAQCCAIAFGNSTSPVYYTFNESARTFTTKSNATDGKFDDFDEEGWTLLPQQESSHRRRLHQQHHPHRHELGTLRLLHQHLDHRRQHRQATLGFRLRQRLWQLRSRTGSSSSRRHSLRHRLERLRTRSHRHLQLHQQHVEARP